MGGWGLDWATRVLPQVPGASLAGCVDARAAARAEVVARGLAQAANCFASLEEALDNLEVSAVLVTTDLPSHIPLVLASLRADKHVLVEKPFAPSVAAAEEAVALAEQRGLSLVVSQNYRYYPAVRAAQQFKREARLGRLLHIDLDFRRYSAPVAGAPAGHRAWDQPLLLDMAIHHFDLLRAVTGTEPTSVSCATWNPPWASFREAPEGCAVIEFDGGVTVNYRGSWVHSGPPTLWAGEWRMVFEGGELWWESRADMDSALEDKATVYDRKNGPHRLALPRLRYVDRAGVLDAFITSLAAGPAPETAGRDNLKSLALAHAAVTSSRHGGPVLLPGLPS
jgi:predicted dehydrogenase